MTHGREYTIFFYKQLHFWVQPGVAKAFLQFQPQSCLMVASSVQISALVACRLLDETRNVTFLCPRFHLETFLHTIYSPCLAEDKHLTVFLDFG